MWVALLAVLLTGIVFLNVALLEINGSIAQMDERSAQLRRDNAALRMRVARLGSSERIQRAAAGRGFVPAEPGQVGYLATGPADAAEAARALERWPASPPAGADGSPAARPGGAPTTSPAGTGSATATPTPGAGTEPATDSPTAGADASMAAPAGGSTAAGEDGATETPASSYSTPESPSSGEESAATP